MENKDNKSNEMSEEVITNDATKDGATRIRTAKAR